MYFVGGCIDDGLAIAAYRLRLFVIAAENRRNSKSEIGEN